MGPGGHALPAEPWVQPEPGTVPHPQLQEDLPRPEDAQEILDSGGARRIVQVGWAVFWGGGRGGSVLRFYQLCSGLCPPRVDSPAPAEWAHGAKV